MAFKRFENQGGKSSNPLPMLSIWKRGAAGFNIAAYELCNLDKYSFIETYFDEITNRIGFRFVPGKTAFSRSLSKRPSGCTFALRAFLKYHKIDYSAVKKYRLEFDEANNLFFIQL